MLFGLWKSKFFSKCKLAMEMTKKRIGMLKRERNRAMVRILKQDVVDLLAKGLDSNAYSLVDELLDKINLSICYDLVDQYCDHLLAHLPAMDKQKDQCPEECVEAVSSLMFGAAGFYGLPELIDLRAIFSSRYGNSVEFFVDQEFVKKLTTKRHSKDVKIQLMQDIASESGFKWNSSDLVEKLQKPPTELSPRKEAISLEKPLLVNSNRGHVHPKMPDYEDVVAQLEAVRQVESRNKMVIFADTNESNPREESRDLQLVNPNRRHVHSKMPEYEDFRARLEALREADSHGRSRISTSVEPELDGKSEMEKMKVLVGRLALTYDAQGLNSLPEQVSSFYNINNNSSQLIGCN